MDKNYKITEGKLIIKDSYKQHVLFLNIAMVALFLSSILTISSNDEGIGTMSIISVAIALGSLVLLVLNNYNKTTKTEIDLTQIESISQKSKVHGRSYFLKLKNGKERYLPELKRKDILDKLKQSIN